MPANPYLSPRDDPLTEDPLLGFNFLLELEGAAAGPLTDIHFDYDSFDLGETARQILQQNAGWLNRHLGARVEIEGHCDNRGTIDRAQSGRQRSEFALQQPIRHAGPAR